MDKHIKAMDHLNKINRLFSEAQNHMTIIDQMGYNFKLSVLHDSEHLEVMEKEHIVNLKPEKVVSMLAYSLVEKGIG